MRAVSTRSLNCRNRHFLCSNTKCVIPSTGTSSEVTQGLGHRKIACSWYYLVGLIHRSFGDDSALSLSSLLQKEPPWNCAVLLFLRNKEIHIRVCNHLPGTTALHGRKSLD